MRISSAAVLRCSINFNVEFDRRIRLIDRFRFAIENGAGVVFVDHQFVFQSADLFITRNVIQQDRFGRVTQQFSIADFETV